MTRRKFTNVHDVIGLWVVSKPVIEQGKLCITEGHRIGLKKEGERDEGITTTNSIIFSVSHEGWV